MSIHTILESLILNQFLKFKMAELTASFTLCHWNMFKISIQALMGWLIYNPVSDFENSK